ncbi:MAG: TIGR01459 family HAD-type hydrolase [Geminicoccaceae bacterium]
MASIPRHTSLRDIADGYDAFVLDLWGVIHGGVTPFPGVPEALAALKARGKKIALLSNAPRRSEIVMGQLTGRIGLDRALFDVMLTSGEATHDALRDRPDDDHASLGKRFYCINYDMLEQRGDLADGLDYQEVEAVEDAEFILVIGPFQELDEIERYEPLLAHALSQGMPMVCANPDRVIHRQDGPPGRCAGWIAEAYANRGGKVIWHGKPDPKVYHRALNMLGHQGTERAVMIGDSLTTDIPGARLAGMDALFCTRGIFHAELDIAAGEMPEQARLDALCARFEHQPTGAIPSLVW